MQSGQNSITCANCQKFLRYKHYICDILCENNKTNHRRNVTVDLCMECWQLMMLDQDKFLKEFKIKREHTDIEMKDLNALV